MTKETKNQFKDISHLVSHSMPYSIRILLENVVRNQGENSEQAKALMRWREAAAAGEAIDVYATRVFLHDTNGVPLLTDLAAMRDAVTQFGIDPEIVNPLIPAELTVDHSVIADFFGSKDATEKNVEIEYQRNDERYKFLKWGQQNFQNFKVVPPGTGIMHQINCEYLARVVEDRDGEVFPDLCLGTDSHTTMVNGVGVLAWGIGGIEAEAVMMGEPYSMVVPEIVGVKLVGSLRSAVTATDLVLTITERLRAFGVVGKFVEFFGPAISSLAVEDRTTIANMAPEFGSTCAYFPIDQKTLDYLEFTGRSEEHVGRVLTYSKSQLLWHDENVEPSYDHIVILNLEEVEPSIAGPRRPQDRVPLSQAKSRFQESNLDLARAPANQTVEMKMGGVTHQVRNGLVAIAAITSCTNTSNPKVMISAGLLAQKARAFGLKSKPWVKTTLSPGSKVVSDYFDRAGLTADLEHLGFYLAGYGCMTCIGASGGLVPEVEDLVRGKHLEVAAVLSGNRNFDGRINPDVRFNYLASPPLVVAYAIAGTMDFDFEAEPLGSDHQNHPVYLKDIWPKDAEIEEVIRSSIESKQYVSRYSEVFEGNELWQKLPSIGGSRYEWNQNSTYLRRPNFMDSLSADVEELSDIEGARVLALLGDQITTDHLSPAGSIPVASVAGKYLTELGVAREDLNTYASRRGNFEVMMRGTLANVRLRNLLVPDSEGNHTINFLTGQRTSIFDASQDYREAGIPTLIIGGENYGAGSSRDWGAKGPALLGVRVVIAQSYERIHRSNLICMGILPLQFYEGDSAKSLGLDGTEVFSVRNLEQALESGMAEVRAGDKTFMAKVRVDTQRERVYLRNGGVLPYVLRKLAAKAS